MIPAVEVPPMHSLSRNTLQRLLSAIHIMNSVDNHADFAMAVLDGMSRLITADFTNLHVLNPASGELLHVIAPENPYTEDEIAYYRSHPDQNPLVAYYRRSGDTHARRMSEVASHDEYLSSGIFRHCNARIGIRYILVIPLQVDEYTVAGLTFMRRQRDFSAQDGEVLDAFAPHFRLAWQRHPNPWQLVPSDAMSSRQRFMQELELTTREADVLYWITEGKQNAEIAQILNISLFTVQKHVANILKKTQLENRSVLTVSALKLRGTGKPPA